MLFTRRPTTRDMLVRKAVRLEWSLFIASDALPFYVAYAVKQQYKYDAQFSVFSRHDYLGVGKGDLLIIAFVSLSVALYISYINLTNDIWTFILAHFLINQFDLIVSTVTYGVTMSIMCKCIISDCWCSCYIYVVSNIDVSILKNTIIHIYERR